MFRRLRQRAARSLATRWREATSGHTQVCAAQCCLYMYNERNFQLQPTLLPSRPAFCRHSAIFIYLGILGPASLARAGLPTHAQQATAVVVWLGVRAAGLHVRSRVSAPALLARGQTGDCCECCTRNSSVRAPMSSGVLYQRAKARTGGGTGICSCRHCLGSQPSDAGSSSICNSSLPAASASRAVWGAGDLAGAVAACHLAQMPALRQNTSCLSKFPEG